MATVLLQRSCKHHHNALAVMDSGSEQDAASDYGEVGTEMVVSGGEGVRGSSQNVLDLQEDCNWRVPILGVLPPSEFEIINNLASMGVFANLGGQCIAFVDPLCMWLPLTSSYTQSFLIRAIGISNVSSGIGVTFRNFSGSMFRHCLSRTVITPPVSVNFSTRRLEVYVEDSTNTLTFTQCRPLLVDELYVGDRHDIMNSVCYNPVLTENVPTQYKFPGRQEILSYLSVLFVFRVDLLGLCWFVGNSIVDPVHRSRILMLTGPGGSGKSKVVEAVVRSLSGCCCYVPDGILTSDKEHVRDDMIRVLASSRIAQNAEVNLERQELNAHIIKMLTGGDTLSIDGINTVVTTSLLIGTNGAPDPADEVYTSDAVLRRMYAIHMSVNALELPPASLPGDPVATMDFLCACIYARLKTPHPMLSGKSLVATLTMKLFVDVERLLKFTDPDVPVDILSAVNAVGVVAGALQVSPEEVIRRVKLISPSCLGSYGFNTYILGVTTSP